MQKIIPIACCESCSVMRREWVNLWRRIFAQNGNLTHLGAAPWSAIRIVREGASDLRSSFAICTKDNVPNEPISWKDFGAWHQWYSLSGPHEMTSVVQFNWCRDCRCRKIGAESWCTTSSYQHTPRLAAGGASPQQTTTQPRIILRPRTQWGTRADSCVSSSSHCALMKRKAVICQPPRLHG